MDSRDPIRDFFTFLLGAVLLSMGVFLFFNQVVVSSDPTGAGLRFGRGFGRYWGGGYASSFGGGLMFRSLRGNDDDKEQKDR
jgi:hypothetical protein